MWTGARRGPGPHRLPVLSVLPGRRPSGIRHRDLSISI